MIAERIGRQPAKLTKLIRDVKDFKAEPPPLAGMRAAVPDNTAPAIPSCEQWIEDCVTIVDPQPNGDETVIPFKLWAAQKGALELLLTVRLLLVIKARQLGQTWLVLAYCLWVCLYHPNRAVLCFNRDLDGAKEMLRRVSGMYSRLANKPVALVGNAKQELVWSNGSRIKCLAATKHAGSSYTASIIVADEFAKMQWAAEMYTATKPAINDGNAQYIIISTGNGQEGLFAKLRQQAIEGLNNFVRLFIPWFARPGRTQEWYAEIAKDAVSLPAHQQEYPATEDEAFQTLTRDPFLEDMAWWDACRDDAMPAITARTVLVVALDAGYINDSFGLVAVSPHPTIAGDVCVRFAQAWRPQDKTPLDFHMDGGPLKTLDRLIAGYVVEEVAYDAHQLHSDMTTLKNSGRVSVRQFSQGNAREIADKALRDMIMGRRIHHDGNPVLRQHIQNAVKKVDKDKHMRIDKLNDQSKVDLAVSLSMSVDRVLRLAV